MDCQSIAATEANDTGPRCAADGVAVRMTHNEVRFPRRSSLLHEERVRRRGRAGGSRRPETSSPLGALSCPGRRAASIMSNQTSRNC